jgi:hypothetical protein
VRRLACVAGAATLVVAACGGSSTARRDEDPRVAVVHITEQGGFAAESRRPAQLPRAVVLGDGSVITEGPTTLEFPGPALPNLQEVRLTPQGLARVVDEGRRAGLFDDPPPDYGDVGVTDQPTTTVTMSVDGRTRRVHVYALDFDEGLRADQRENRARLQRFIRLAGDPGALRPFVVPGSERRYEPTSLAVLVRPSDTADGDVHAWPLGDLAGTDCVVLTGADAATATAAARSAREGDVWESASATYTVTFRPLLPDERTCADLSPNR